MKQRNAHAGRSEEEVINVFDGSAIRATVCAHQRGCGHAGHFVDVEVFLEPKKIWLGVGLFTDLMLHAVIMLLQEAEETINSINGVKRLPTVRLDGASYFVDRTLGEFRNVDNPNDRIAMERTA